MFDAVLDQLKQRAIDVLKTDNGMEAAEAERTADAAGKTLAAAAKERIGAKDFSLLDEALSGSHTDTSNPVLQSLTAPLVSGLVERLGIDTDKAQRVAGTLLPFAFNMFNDQVQQARAGGVDINALVRQLASGGLNFSNMGAAMTLAKQFMKGQSGKAGIGNMFSRFF